MSSSSSSNNNNSNSSASSNTNNNNTNNTNNNNNAAKRAMKTKPQAEKEIKPKKTQEEKDKSFITSQEIISRIKWDEKFSTFLDDFTIGYLDRFEGLMKCSVQEFEDSGEIPYHRIWFVYFNGIIIWDREKRIDNVSKGKLEVIISEYFINKQKEEERKRAELEKESKKKKKKRQPVASASSESSSQPTEQESQRHSSDEEGSSEEGGSSSEDDGEQQITEQVISEPLEPNTEDILSAYAAQYKTKRVKKVMFSKNKTRKAQEQYEPEDDLEKWLLENNETNEALVLQFPTMISQRGGHYHIIFDSQKKYNEYINAWKSSIEKNQICYIEEMRTKHAFKLYVDIDIKLTVPNSPYNIIEHGWIKLIQDFAKEYFQGSQDVSMLVTECHSNWHDKTNKTAKYKSGYRLFFPSIVVDYDKFCDFTYQLSYHMLNVVGSYENQPEDWSFEDVIDLKSCNHPRVRLFGTTKWRRGRLLPRKYTFAGWFNTDSELDEKKTTELKNNLFELLRLTSARIEDPFEE
ncbi:predicted protein [Naegleria gruberi]|uniref:Predicted protein n=1 Tax=Naegleria gruberi TaxID=5762 RepID=D2VMB7_NAEGR|nr:uncharacterized protein NAEGRDRAFT_50733 [Naegleria gruberi]EFC41960.1 predicted protein [Naegleria gruberi]|eukprot:XP_002674704.1 predicted protein [Naegleria gruberi strain NEG-M]